MARKNGLKNDSNSSLTFNTRTKAVMADVVQDNIKEKVNSVREVVSGKSNNEIVLVLQYYDYDVEKTIQAYLEDGAQEALQQWQFSGTKPVKKKRNKKKASEVPRSPESVSSESGSAASFMVNGEASREPVMNGILDHEPDISRPSKILTNGPTSSTYQVPTISTTVPVVPSTTLSSSNSSTLPADSSSGKSAEVKFTSELRAEDKGAKEKSPSPQPQRHQSHHHNHHNRPRTHSGSHGHSEGRDRTTSTSSIGSQSGKKHAHLGLERSAKDLHRQTVSLERLRLIFIEEVDRSHKRIKSVFDEIRIRLNAKENLLMGQLNDLKQAGDDVFTMRQGLASDLKVQIDRAERMSEDELAALRLEIKHFVSDRKVDEDLAKTIRFMYDDKLKDDISVFGEIVPLKCQYVQSNISPRKPEVDKKEVVHIPKPVVNSKPSSDSQKKTPVSHLDSSQTEEMAQLQRRLKHSLTLEGIPVETFPERPDSAPVASNSVKTNNSPRPDNARRNYNRNQRRNDRPRPESAKEDNRSSFNQQAPGGERVILIGRKTGPQGGPGRGRGGRGRGRGRGGYSGQGRGQNYNSDNVNNSMNGQQNEASPSEPRGQSASPPKPQRENSNYNRRGSGRGSGGNSGRRGNSNPGSSGSMNRPNSNTTETKEG